ncbi:MAG: ABC transporter ATP-binding protein [Candidatus Dormibacteraeota bacterium]|uniref:ABC transporter ATP-binding protein n=1 Tax=Candidatus Dormiibacter inghamiae TaxID=3127013 RepID=A0A934NAU6_9BACT|nr:ABC transporter ATP-binding protein [Candidatus Dormibacteraeota bacterium]MBJ7605278.1 ABC transporter ATP-binding protein [Candidatus Dormibacteraeota bacterium]
MARPSPARPADLNPDRSLATIEVNGITKTYRTRTGAVNALAEVDCTIKRGEFVSLLGPSGCGKSTLLRIMAGLSSSSSGSVIIDGNPVIRPQTQLGIVFQSPVLLEWRDTLGNVMLQAEARGIDRRVALETANRLVKQVGLAGFERKRPSELSGGMQQRVAICRALLHDPDIVLMDEPFGALDALTRDQMNVDLQHLWAQGEKTVVFVTHSIPEAVFLSDRVLVMSPSPGRIDLGLRIDLERPRRLATRDSPQFAAYCSQIRNAFTKRGVLREEPLA